MNKFVAASLTLHLALFVAVAFSSRGIYKPAKKVEVYKVNLAPLPQPKILKADEGNVTEPEKPVEKTTEKAPPEKEKTPDKNMTKKVDVKKGIEKGSKQGLPDIKPQIYTGSGRGFSYSYYLNIMLNKIGQNWQNPFEGKDIVRKSIVYFEVDKNGKISNIRIEEDSGDEIYNEAAMRAVSITKKLPPLPQELSNDYLKVHLEFLTAQ